MILIVGKIGALPEGETVGCDADAGVDLLSIRVIAILAHDSGCGGRLGYQVRIGVWVSCSGKVYYRSGIR